MLHKLLIAYALFACANSLKCEPLALSRVEPPSWWLGMNSDRLQLMLHGPNIASLSARIATPGARLLDSHRRDSPNYLFLDLQLGEQLSAGDLPIELRDQDDQLRIKLNYPLQQRRPGSAERQGFGPKDVIYLLVPDRFANGDPDNDSVTGMRESADRNDPNGRHGGDLAGMRDALDYLQQMGFTQIWPTPLLENDQPDYSYHGYAATDLYRIDPRFGSNEDYRDFVEAAAQRGIGVIQDIVLNHIGSEHWWMADPPTHDWISLGGEFAPTNHARTTVQDPYAAASDRRAFSDGWFVQSMPDLNQRNPLLATWLIQHSLWWIEYSGITGIREDTYSYADPDFLSVWSARILTEYPNFSIVGEEWSRNPLVVSHWQAGNAARSGYSSSTAAMMDFPLYYELIESLNQPESWEGGLMRLYQALVNDRLYAQPSKMILFEGNHDTSRLFTLLGEDLNSYRAAMVYLLTMPRTPQLFYGSEVLMTSPLQRDDGRLRGDFPGGWPGDERSARSGKGLSDDQLQAQSLLRRLLNWRKQARVIHQGKLTHFAPQDGLYVYFRHDGEALVMVAINRSTEACSLALERFEEVLGERRKGREIGTGAAVDLQESRSIPAGASWVLDLHDRESD